MIDEHIVRQLIAMKIAHAKPSAMLHYMREAAPGRASDWVDCMQGFRRAFGLSIKQVSPILGWHTGELSDSELDGFLLPEVYSS